MKLIDKAAVVAEIKERIETYNKGYANGDDRRADALEVLLHDIDTLEVKEVDLDALGVLAEHLIACDAHVITPKFSDREVDILEGLVNNKAQKGK